MTETCCVISSTDPTDHLLGHVGGPLACNEIKLVDIEEMGYFSTDQPYPRGEILVRGKNAFMGYYKDEKTTAATLLVDGWVATGDVGRWNPNGSLSIIDRRKNLFKLAQGEYIAVEFVESVYSKVAAVNQLWIYGNSFKSVLLGVVVPSADWWSRYSIDKKWLTAEQQHLKPTDPQFLPQLMQSLQSHQAEVKTEMKNQLKTVESGLKGFERVADWLIEFSVDVDGNAWNPANQCLTPTFKLRRQQLLEKYKPQLKQMYKDLGEAEQVGEKWPGDP